MKRNLRIALFVLAAAAQLAVPASLILRREQTLRHGEVFRFRTAPVDPYDAFRGRYVAVRVEPDTVDTAGPAPREGRWVCVGVAAGPDGFARLTTATTEPPAAGAWMRVRVRYGSGRTLHLELPFDRFYMEESDAPRAEQVYRDAARRDGPQDAWLVVRVYRGRAVIEDLFVGGRPVKDVLKDAAAKP